eukprot:tig00020603_g11800.t1
MRVLVTPLDPEQPVPATPARALGPREPQTAARRHLSRNAPWLSSPGACKASLKLRPPGAAELLRIPRVASSLRVPRRGLSAGPLAPNAPPKLLPPRLGLAHVAGSLRVPLRRTPRPSSSTPPRPRARRELSAGPRERSAPRKLLPPRLGLARVAGSLRRRARALCGSLAPNAPPKLLHPASASRASRALCGSPCAERPAQAPPPASASRGARPVSITIAARPGLVSLTSRPQRSAATAVEHQRQRPEQMNSSPRPTGAATEATDVPRKRWRHRCAAGRCAALMSCEPGLMPPKHVRPLSFPKAPTPLGRPIISCSAALRDAARLAVEAALDVRGIAFERAGVALRPHNGFARPAPARPAPARPAAPPRRPCLPRPAPPLPARPARPPALTRAQGPASCRRTSCGRASGRASCSSPAISSPRWRRRSVRAQGQGEDEVAACEHNDAPLEGYDAEGGFSRKLNTGLVVELVLVDKSDTAKPAFANFNAQVRMRTPPCGPCPGPCISERWPAGATI